MFQFFQTVTEKYFSIAFVVLIEKVVKQMGKPQRGFRHYFENTYINTTYHPYWSFIPGGRTKTKRCDVIILGNLTGEMYL